jgi:hypothetical protein
LGGTLVNPLASTLANTNWVQVQTTSGKLAPGESVSIAVAIHIRALLAGTYTSTVSFGVAAGHGAVNSPQMVAISLTVLPRCGVMLGTASMTFTGVSGQAITNQSLNLLSNASCQGTVNWSATSSAPWLLPSPVSGSIAGATGATMTVGVKTDGLEPGSYAATITVAAAHSTQTVAVMLIVQSSPKPGVPVLNVNTASLSFSTEVGENTSTLEQALGISNTGQSKLYWQASVADNTSWLHLSAVTGTLAPGQIGHLLVDVTPGTLTPGTYETQVILRGIDGDGQSAGGSPQLINVTLSVNAPCTVILSPASTLSFSATQGGADPSPQQVILSVSGSCAWPVSWQVRSSALAWLALPAPASGTFTASGQSVPLTIVPSAQNQQAGTYHGMVSIAATDSNGLAVQGSPLSINVVLNIQKSCTMQVSTNGNGPVSLSVDQGVASAVQNIPLAFIGHCAWPVTWTAYTTTVSGGNWLKLISHTGSDSGMGSMLSLQVDATSLLPGTYSALITFTASDASSATLNALPTIAVSATINGYTVSGTVNSCNGSTFCVPRLLAGTIVTLTGGNLSLKATTATDGTFQFSNVANGTYTLAANGQSVTITVNGGSVNQPITIPPPLTMTPVGVGGT